MLYFSHHLPPFVLDLAHILSMLIFFSGMDGSKLLTIR